MVEGSVLEEQGILIRVQLVYRASVLTDQRRAASFLSRRQNANAVVNETTEEKRVESRSRSRKSQSPRRDSQPSVPNSVGGWEEAKGAASCAIAAAAAQGDDHDGNHLWERVRELMRQRRKGVDDKQDESARNVPDLSTKARGSGPKGSTRPDERAEQGRADNPKSPSPPAANDIPPALSPSRQSPTVAAVQDQHKDLLDSLVKTHTREASVLRETINVMKEERQAQDWQLMDALAQAKSANQGIWW